MTDYDSTNIDPVIHVASSCPADFYTHCVYDENYGNNGFTGWNQCSGSSVRQLTNPNRICGTQLIRVNLYYSAPRQKVMCHEFGHSLGFQHSKEALGNSCMDVGTTSTAKTTLSSTDKSEINARYPS